VSHRFFEGEILHHRFHPKKHHFSYDFFFLDVDVDALNVLSSRFFSTTSFAPMGFFARDHFGESRDFSDNAYALLERLGWQKPSQLRFITLPRIFHFVFNPISVLLLLDESQKPTHMVVEVHNYNGGRVLYPMMLEPHTHDTFKGSHPKTMYVSPFLGYEGVYTFTLGYTQAFFSLKIELAQANMPMLMAYFKGESKPFTSKTIHSLLWRHTFLTLFVVTRTLWQTVKLALKGIAWAGPRAIDQTRKDLA
jgi:uncharacterized protein